MEGEGAQRGGARVREHSTGGDWKPPADGHCLQTPGKGGRVGKRQGNNPHGGRAPSLPRWKPTEAGLKKSQKETARVKTPTTGSL